MLPGGKEGENKGEREEKRGRERERKGRGGEERTYVWPGQCLNVSGISTRVLDTGVSEGGVLNIWHS